MKISTLLEAVTAADLRRKIAGLDAMIQILQPLQERKPMLLN